MWGSLFLYLHFVVAIAVVFRVLVRPRMEPSVRLAWILIVETVPLVGIVAYILFGEVRMSRAEKQRMTDVRARLSGLWRPSPNLVATPPDYVAPVIAANRAIGMMQALSGNAVTLLPEDDSAIHDLAEAIDGAKTHVHLLFYIWLPDVSGALVAEAVIRAARRGVKCRIVVDDVGSRLFLRSKWWPMMVEAGAECVKAFPVGNPLISAVFKRVDLRNHRKIAVIDYQTGFSGSRNCSDMAFATKPKFAPWIDVFFRIEGPAVRQMQAIFLQDWITYTGKDLGEMLEFMPAAHQPGVIAQVIGTGPDTRDNSIADAMAAMIFAARERLTITTPYYVPNNALDSAIRAAARRGVDVTLILPARNDSMVVNATSQGFFYGLVAAGVKLHLFQGGLLHAKIMSVDGKMVMVGSANLDRRSFELNYEMNLLFAGPGITAEIDARQRSYLARSVPVSLDEIRQWSVMRRVRNNILALAAPLL